LSVFIYLVLITSGAGLVMSTVPPLASVSAIIWGVALILGGHLTGRWQLIAVMGSNLLLLYGLSGSSNLFYILIFGFPALAMGLLLNADQGYYQLQKWGMIVALLLVSLFMGLAYYNSGAEGTLWEQAAMDRYVQESVKLSEDSGFIAFYEQQGLGQPEMQADIERAGRWMFMHLPALYYLQAILAVWLVLRLSAYLSRRKGLPILYCKPFREEIMPGQLAWVVIVALVLWLWGRDAMNDWYYMGSNLLLIAVPVTSYYGLAILSYHLAVLKPLSQRWAVSSFIILALLFTPVIVIFVSLLGLFDSLQDYRKLKRTGEGTL
jgi:Predicted membrane protein (DUF2232)